MGFPKVISKKMVSVQAIETAAGHPRRAEVLSVRLAASIGVPPGGAPQGPRP